MIAKAGLTLLAAVALTAAGKTAAQPQIEEQKTDNKEQATGNS